MLATNYTTCRRDFKSYCDKAVRERETIIVTRKNDENIVMMSLDSYNNLMANLEIRSNRTNYQHIMEGVHQLETGRTKKFTDDEWEQMMHEQGIR